MNAKSFGKIPALAGLTALLTAFGAAAGDVRLTLEAPADGVAYTGVSNLRGWAVSSAGIDRVELYIDGIYRTDIPYGGKRNDVGDAFPQYPGADKAGFSMAFNMNNLANGPHRITVQAVDNDGDRAEAAATFEVNGFHQAFFPDLDAVDMSQASASGTGNRITIRNMSVDGVAYDITLVWRAEAQGFQFDQIAPAGTL